jgi:hypothetical protein
MLQRERSKITSTISDGLPLKPAIKGPLRWQASEVEGHGEKHRNRIFI